MEEEIDENTIAHLHLKQLLMSQIEVQDKQIEIQEKSMVLFQKILRRISIIYISISLTILVGIMFVIYIVSRPNVKADILIKQFKDLNTRISLQREYIDMDRKDLVDFKDSVNAFKDSVNNAK